MVAERLPRSARLDGDELNRMIVNGFVWALGEPADKAARQVELLHRNLCALARRASRPAGTATPSGTRENGSTCRGGRPASRRQLTRSAGRG